MIEQLISKVFAARNAAHLAHWATGSYAEHVALGDFYEKAIDLIDDFIESYQGAFGKIGKFELNKEKSQDIIAMLAEQAQWMNENSEALCNDISATENLLDNLIDLYLKTSYKLKELK